MSGHWGAVSKTVLIYLWSRTVILREHGKFHSKDRRWMKVQEQDKRTFVSDSGRPATLRDVAKAAGVHPATASRALNPATSVLVSEDAWRRVSEAAERLGYRPMQGSQTPSPRGLLLSVYVPSQQLYAAEHRWFLACLTEWLAQTWQHGVRQSVRSTTQGTKFEFYSDDGISQPALRTQMDAFAHFLDTCATSPTAANDLLRDTGVSAATATAMVTRYSKEVRRVQMDARHSREQRMLSLRQTLEGELLEAGVDLRTALGVQLDELLDELIPPPSSAASPHLITSASGAGPSHVINISPNASVIINQKTFEAMEQTIIESVQGTVYLGADAKEILNLIRRFADRDASTLTMSVHELEDPDAEPGSRRNAKVKLKQFLAQLAGKAEDAVLVVAQRYLESKIM